MTTATASPTTHRPLAAVRVGVSVPPARRRRGPARALTLRPAPGNEGYLVVCHRGDLGRHLRRQLRALPLRHRVYLPGWRAWWVSEGGLWALAQDSRTWRRAREHAHDHPAPPAPEHAPAGGWEDAGGEDDGGPRCS